MWSVAVNRNQSAPKRHCVSDGACQAAAFETCSRCTKGGAGSGGAATPKAATPPAQHASPEQPGVLIVLLQNVPLLGLQLLLCSLPLLPLPPALLLPVLVLVLVLPRPPTLLQLKRFSPLLPLPPALLLLPLLLLVLLPLPPSLLLVLLLLHPGPSAHPCSPSLCCPWSLRASMRLVNDLTRLGRHVSCPQSSNHSKAPSCNMPALLAAPHPAPQLPSAHPGPLSAPKLPSAHPAQLSAPQLPFAYRGSVTNDPKPQDRSSTSPPVAASTVAGWMNQAGSGSR